MQNLRIVHTVSDNKYLFKHLILLQKKEKEKKIGKGNP